MKFSNITRINPEALADDIPVIHGQNYYINEEAVVCTFNNSPESVFDQSGMNVAVKSLTPVTEFIYIVNNKLSFKTDRGILVTNLTATKQNYRGGFQGIIGFDTSTSEYQFINSNVTAKSDVTFTARVNTSRKLEILIDELNDVWTIPLGEFRCFIDNQLYTINYNTLLPNTFGDTFTITLPGWTTVNITPTTNYIIDAFVAGNTLYLSTRTRQIGSAPYDWTKIDTTESTVIWSEDSRLIGGNIVGNATASQFFIVNYNTSTIYWIDAKDFSILQEYIHKQPILGTGSIDKFSIAIVDKEAVSILSAYVSLNTWLIKPKLYFSFNQLSAYEDITTNYLREEVKYVRDLDALFISSTQRENMILYILDNKVLSGCHTNSNCIIGDFSAYLIENDTLYKYTKVEDSGEYEELDKAKGIINFENYIYIGSDLEPDIGGSTMRDTEIKFEGKLALVDGDDVSIESSGDVPKDKKDLPVRTDQDNPDNWWYLYTKTLRYPVSYTDWIKISLMPTTKIISISLVEDPNKPQKGKK
jgi:hypothetical protein